MKLDQTDKKIIQLLGADARMSNNQMAKVIGCLLYTSDAADE